MVCPLVVRVLSEYRNWPGDGKNCLRGGGVEEFAELIERVAADKTIRERLSHVARRTAEEYSMERIGRRLVELYTELLNGGKPLG